MNKRDSPDSTTRMVVNSLRDHIRTLGPGMRQKVIAHSQGAAVLSAAISFLSLAERSCLDVTTYGGAAYTYPEGIGLERHVVNIWDPVPLLVGKRLLPHKTIEYRNFVNFLALNHAAVLYQEEERFWDLLKAPINTLVREKIEWERQKALDISKYERW